MRRQEKEVKIKVRNEDDGRKEKHSVVKEMRRETIREETEAFQFLIAFFIPFHLLFSFLRVLLHEWNERISTILLCLWNRKEEVGLKGWVCDEERTHIGGKRFSSREGERERKLRSSEREMKEWEGSKWEKSVKGKYFGKVRYRSCRKLRREWEGGRDSEREKKDGKEPYEISSSRTGFLKYKYFDVIHSRKKEPKKGWRELWEWRRRMEWILRGRERERVRGMRKIHDDWIVKYCYKGSSAVVM